VPGNGRASLVEDVVQVVKAFDFAHEAIIAVYLCRRRVSGDL
jgi:hypothetical protein